MTKIVVSRLNDGSVACVTCPLFRSRQSNEYGGTSEGWCLVGRVGHDSFSSHEKAPAWCPLRTGPVTFELEPESVSKP